MPQVRNPSIGPGASALLVNSSTLTAAQLLALSTTPVQLIATPGAGKLLIVLGMAFVFKAGANLYQVNGSDDLNIGYSSAISDTPIPTVSNLIANAPNGWAYFSGSEFVSGAWGPGDDNQGLFIKAANSYAVGPIVTTTLGAGGLGYAANDTGTISTGSGDATYQVLTVGAGGAVLTYSITAPGTRYAVANGVATATGGAQPGVGVGFTVNITAVQTGDGTLKVATYYQIFAVP
jgi:hypothetical protein